MPEGPTIVILKKALKPFKGRRVTAVSGYAKGVRPSMLEGNTITGIKSWGKYLLISFKKITVSVHMGLFGSHKINSHGKRNASLHLQLDQDEINFYISNIKVIEGSLDKTYDWSADIMSRQWDARKAMNKLKAKPEMMICDALLDQKIFAGSGNIIKNESLFIARIHPESYCGKIPHQKLEELIEYLVQFSADFVKWKEKGTLSRHLKAYEKDMCPRNHIPFHKTDTGKTKRHSYYCDKCQELYD
jgi:endonuclease-8